MRRLGVILILVIAAGALAAAVAGADDKHKYKVEFDNAFGLVVGSDVKVAGVKDGSITGLDINSAKRAVVEIEVAGEFSKLTKDSRCSSEPQSLIAEFFVDCQPGRGDELPEGGTIPVENTETTVTQDLVNNTLREPFKRRLQIIINEFGTGLAGRPQDLNDAIRRGAPALRETQKVLDVLGRQNKTITKLNVNSDKVIGELAGNRKDVVKWVESTKDTAVATAERRGELKQTFNRFDDLLFELRPTMAALGDVAEEQTPVLNDLRASSGQLNTLMKQLGPFSDASKPSIDSLGKAAVPGRRAFRKGADEIRELRRASVDLRPAADDLGKLVEDLDDRGRAVEPDVRSPGGKGYTGLEGLLNYVYYQTGAINQFDQFGYQLHFILNEIESGKCHEYATEPSRVSNGALERCVSWLGPNQPNITTPLNLPRYDKSVCPGGSDAPELCDPNTSSSASRGRTVSDSAPAPTQQAEAPAGGGGGGEGGAGGNAPGGPQKVPELPGNLNDILELPDQALGLPDGGQSLGLNGRDPATTRQLMDFLFTN